jgi:hypothetical protein
MLDAMWRRALAEIPADLRPRLETARLDLLALFRALERMHLTPEQIPQRLIRQLFELDADYVESLWGLDQPPGKLNLQAMLRDTLAALDQLPSQRRKNVCVTGALFRSLPRLGGDSRGQHSSRINDPMAEVLFWRNGAADSQTLVEMI